MVKISNFLVKKRVIAIGVLKNFFWMLWPRSLKNGYCFAILTIFKSSSILFNKPVPGHPNSDYYFLYLKLTNFTYSERISFERTTLHRKLTFPRVFSTYACDEISWKEIFQNIFLTFSVSDPTRKTSYSRIWFLILQIRAWNWRMIPKKTVIFWYI